MAPASVLRMIHLKTATLRGYRERRLAPAGLLAADEHLAECEECREALLDQDGGAAADEIIDALTAEDAHLSYDALEAWVDDTLSPLERRTASSHLQSCAQCSADLADLRGMAASLPTATKPGRSVDRSGMTLRIAAAALLAILGAASWFAINQRSQTQAPPNTPAPSASTRPIETLHDGSSTITLRGNGSIAGFALSAADTALVRDAMTTGRLTIAPRATGLQRRSGTLMGAAGKSGFNTVSPIATLVRDTRPRFAWTSLQDGATYRVEVYDESRNLVLESQPLTAVEWTPDHDLTRGRDYIWQVVATRGNERLVAPQPPAAEAHFGVVDDAAAARVDAIARANGPSHLLLAVTAAREGLLDDARRELNALAKLNPHSATVARLLRSLPPQSQ